MTETPAEANPVTRFILGLAVILAMMAGGGAVGALVRPLDVSFATPVGVAVGALAVFVAFGVLYQRYSSSP
jgi:hypothetical protein